MKISVNNIGQCCRIVLWHNFSNHLNTKKKVLISEVFKILGHLFGMQKWSCLFSQYEKSNKLSHYQTIQTGVQYTLHAACTTGKQIKARQGKLSGQGTNPGIYSSTSKPDE